MSNHPKQAGFTLVELLIVVVILGILAAVVIPQFNNAAAESKESALASNLATIRQAVELYKVQHSDSFPGSAIINQLTKKTDTAGTVSATGKYGPYLRNGFPKNPIDGDATVTVTATGTIATPGATSVGWAYDSTTGEFRANVTGTGPSGTDYFSL